MAKQVDIQDDEFEEEGEEQDDDAAEEAKAKQQEQQQQQQRSEAETRAAITQLHQMVQKISDKTDAGEKVSQKEVSSLEKMTAHLLSEGYKPESLKGSIALLDAMKSDIMKEVEARYADAEKEKGQKSLDEKFLDRMQEELGKLIEGKPELQGDQEFQEMVLKKMWTHMSTDPGMDSARKAYAAGRPPSNADIQKSARLVLQKLPGGFAMVNSDNKNEGIDANNSRPGGSHPAISKKGEVDVEKLNDFERDIYTTTLNCTKDKKLALEALKELGSKKLW